MNAQIKIVSENEKTVQKTLDILKTVFPMNVTSKIMQNDRDVGYHCLLTVDPSQAIKVIKQ